MANDPTRVVEVRLVAFVTVDRRHPDLAEAVEDIPASAVGNGTRAHELSANLKSVPYVGAVTAARLSVSVWIGSCVYLKEEMNMVVKIIPNEKGNPPGKLADAELHFASGALEGLKLIGFSIWERKTGNGRNVTFPARQYSVNGERRSFALLRPVSDPVAQDRIRDLVLQAYAEHEAEQAVRD